MNTNDGLSKTKQRFLELCEDIYYKGMLDYESICESILDSMNISRVEEVLVMQVLEKAQAIFEERNGIKM